MSMLLGSMGCSSRAGTGAASGGDVDAATADEVRRRVGTAAALLLAAAVVQSTLTNPRWEWDVFARWFFAEPVLVGLGRTLLLTAIGTALGTLLALSRVSGSPARTRSASSPRRRG